MGNSAPSSGPAVCMELSLLLPRLLRHCEESSKPNLLSLLRGSSAPTSSPQRRKSQVRTASSCLISLNSAWTKWAMGGASQQKAEVAGSSMFQVWNVYKSTKDWADLLSFRISTPRHSCYPWNYRMTWAYSPMEACFPYSFHHST